MYITEMNLRRIINAMDPIVRHQAETLGVKLKAIVLRCEIANSATAVFRELSLDSCEDSIKAAIEAIDSAKLTFKGNAKTLGGVLKEDGILYMNDNDVFLSDTCGEAAGTGIYFPIVALSYGGQRVIPYRVSAYFALGVVGGTQKQNKDLLLSITPDVFKEVKAIDRTFSLPRALIKR